ncbi:MAG: hypothetical protein A3C03_01000 [Candidatus Colwellbacteria bacterium RIFCSPHIGHO2_02_FULL_45_17]|uniref:Methyltransferase type 11 domain-containing protein n=1 Tax=Candidatus Colwellbacteria bacterium RIFCSPLOWO2_02_FULL_45_11 TaxID=1797692 RepID=A0A1G1ZB72_9BACT|nr:MAG: hypothetical protein A3C03_01000 [Candidatus Colwellbacteria bacterium RIFCSPHIGHO2_02_FULL_45_17]OGY60877.1 MAG: hypothetical protein A3I33_01625 [Candidatus Colwellbacteria bacterium RIFCSPLOWO2_02_FULL_45_11]
MSEEKKIKLHLGCGEKYLEGYINVDFPPSEHSVIEVEADVYKDVRELEYEDGSVDEVRAHHLLEHFSRQEALKLLLQWRRWLKYGGLLYIETPDFEKSAKAYVYSGRRRRFELGRHIFGSAEAKWAYHLDFWDAGKFKYVLKKLGFKNIKIRRFRNAAASHFRHIPLLNILGNILPRALYRKYGGHKLPNIEVKAKKAEVVIDEKAMVREVLSQYLVGNEGEKLLRVWMEDIGY